MKKKNAVYKYKAEGEKNEIDSRGVFTHKTKRFRAEVRRKNIFAGWERGEAFDMEIQKHKKKKQEKMVEKNIYTDNGKDEKVIISEAIIKILETQLKINVILKL